MGVMTSGLCLQEDEDRRRKALDLAVDLARYRMASEYGGEDTDSILTQAARFEGYLRSGAIEDE